MPTVSFGTFAKRRNSTKQPSSLSDQRTVKLKESTSYGVPTFIVTGDDFGYNYAQWGNRYYFITDVRSLHNNLSEVDCVIDPLATYKAEILASTQFVCYSSTSGSTWLADTRIPLLKETKVSSNSSLTGILSNIGCYILTVVGKDACISYAISSEGTLASILSEIQNWRDDGITNEFQKLQAPSSSYNSPTVQSVSPGASQADCFNALYEQLADSFESIGEGWQDIQEKLSTCFASIGDAAIGTGFVGNAYQNAPQCIRSCIWVPFDIALAPSAGGVSSRIYLGVYDTQEVGQPITSKPVTGSNTVNIPWHYTDWRRAVCEDVYMYLPLVGLVHLSGDSITHASSITVEWSATYTDGVITYKLLCGNEVIGSYGGQCSANYPLGLAQQASAGEIFQSILGGLEKTVSGALNSSLSPVSAVAAVTNAGFQGINTSYDVVNLLNTTHISCVGGVGGGAGIGLGRECICYTVAHDTIVNPTDMKDTMGLPTMKPTLLSTLTGFCQCTNAHVEAAAMSQELDAIDFYLNSGFFIE